VSSSKLASGGTVEFVLEHRPGSGSVHVWRVLGDDLPFMGAQVRRMGRKGRAPTEKEMVEAEMAERAGRRR
jgi:hypothetical protein